MNLGQLSRRKQQAEAELAALQAAADGVSDKVRRVCIFPFFLYIMSTYIDVYVRVCDGLRRVCIYFL